MNNLNFLEHLIEGRILAPEIKITHISQNHPGMTVFMNCVFGC